MAGDLRNVRRAFFWGGMAARTASDEDVLAVEDDVKLTGSSTVGVDPTVVSPAALSITAAPAERSAQGRTAHTGSRAPISAGFSAA